MIRYFEFLNPTTEMTLEVVRGNDPPQTITIHAKVGQHGNIFTDAYNEYWQAVDAEEPVYKHHDYEGNIGYLNLREFMLSRRNADAMLSRVKNSSAVIIDLRGNGGGALETLTAIAGYFTDHPHEMAKEIGRVKTHTLMIKPETPRITAPVFVMVDSKSASASEMFARDLQIGKRAIIIGDHSSGRVNAAEFFLEKVGAFDLVAFGTEIAVSKVVMADGEELENRGVNPDEFCIPTAKDLHDKKDPCLDRTLELARAASNRAAQPQP
jgi:carboxyl-terminal processing protease